MRPSGNVMVGPADEGGRTRTRQRRATLVGALVVIGVLSLTAVACGGGRRETTAALVSSSPGAMTRDPHVIVNALDAAGLALCHSDDNDLSKYDIYGLLGAYSTSRYFPHRLALPLRGDGTGGLSCLTSSEPNTGAIEIDVYPSAADASSALRQVGQIWLASWLYGNVAVIVDQTTPRLVAQQVSGVLDRLPGAFRFRVNGH